jgi:hypothetical protein
MLRLNSMLHLRMAYCFGNRLAGRRRVCYLYLRLPLTRRPRSRPTTRRPRHTCHRSPWRSMLN